MCALKLQTAHCYYLLMNSAPFLHFSWYVRLTPGAKKIIMSLPDIIKPTNGRKIQGKWGCMDADTHWFEHTQRDMHLSDSFVWRCLSCSSTIQTQPGCWKSGCQDFWELQWSSNCYGKITCWSCSLVESNCNVIILLGQVNCFCINMQQFQQRLDLPFYAGAWNV